MSKVWYAIPSARPLEEVTPVIDKWLDMGYRVMLWRDKPPVIDKWLDMGYRVMLWRDKPTDASELGWADRKRVFVTWNAVYPGYARAVNALCCDILASDPHADWIVTGGDDVSPDPLKTAARIALECAEHFSGTFGVMQPTGDEWSDVHEGKKSRIIERIAGSPWMGREFCRRMNGGAGPLWPEYTHCFEDEELQLVAQKLGVFWQRPDVTHHHEHWMRRENGSAHRVDPAPPPHLVEASSKAHWDKFKALFESRKAAGFPGHEPIG